MIRLLASSGRKVALLAAVAALAAGAAAAVAQNENAEETDPLLVDPLAGDAPAAGEVEIAPSIPGDVVVLRGLDKLTGEVATFEATVGGEAHYGRLLVEAKACFARPAARAPESSAFLQIYDTKNEPAALSFSGWMFASSPALSAMDHARYDVWVLNCKTS